MIAITMFVSGAAAACYGAYRVDVHDDRAGIRIGAALDGYGSNISYVWPWSPLAQLGFVVALLATVVP